MPQPVKTVYVSFFQISLRDFLNFGRFIMSYLNYIKINNFEKFHPSTPTSGLNSFLCHFLMESKYFNWFGILFDRPFSQYINFCCHFKTKSSSKHWSGKKVDRVWIRPHVCMDFYRKELRYDESNYMDRSPRQLSFRINWKCLNRTFRSRDINLIVREVVNLILLKP